ncbi:MAG: phasin family protein [Pseudomonadota bacterium]
MITNEDTIKMVSDITTKASDNMKQLGELQMNLWNQLMQNQVVAFNTAVESTIAHTQTFKDSKNIPDAVRGQIDFTRKFTQDMVGKARESIEIVQEAGVKYRSFAESTVKEAVNTAKNATKAA